MSKKRAPRRKCGNTPDFRWIAGLVAMSAALMSPAVGHADGRTASSANMIAQSGPAESLPNNCAPRSQFIRRGPVPLGWRVPPSVVILAQAGDPRIRLARNAVAHWNGLFKQLGSGFRLGAVRIGDLTDAEDDYAEKVSDAVMQRERVAPWPPPPGLASLCGSIVVVLANGKFISVTRWITRLGLVYVAIKGIDHYPFDRSNVARNVIAHELGHAIGLRHNKDSDTLMCGRPADCGPERFESVDEKYFPLTEAENTLLRRRYPPQWPERNPDGPSSR